MAVLALCGGDAYRTKPFPAWPVYDEQEKQALVQTLESGEWGIGSTQIDQFELEFAEFCRAKYAIACTNGTDAISIAMQALNIGPGDEVIVPPYTFIATAIGVLAVGATPVFADIHPETYNLDPKSVAEKITSKTKAIIPVHIAGNPADMDGIMALANQHNLFVMEDTAQAPGAEWKGTPVGAIGHLGTCSFQSSKNLAAGEGGALLTNDEALADRIRSFVNCGRVKGGAWYDHHEQGGNHRLGAFQAALLRVGLTRIQDQMSQRSENACYLAKRLQDIPGVQLTGTHEGCTRHAYHLCILRYNKNEFNQLSKKVFIEALNKEGIECAWGYLPLYQYHFFQHFSQKARMYDALYQGLDYTNTHCPVTEHICDNEGVWLFQEMLLGDKQDMDDIANAILKIKENVDEALAYEHN